MIECKDIQRAVGALLRDAGFLVVASEAQEGTQKPSCTVDVFPSESERVGQFMVEDTFPVTVMYYPKIETNEELLCAAKIIKNAVLTKPLTIGWRTIEAFKVAADHSGYVLIVDFSYTVTQYFGADDGKDAPAEELNITMNREDEENGNAGITD